MPKKKDIQELVVVFESMYKYYKGWVFSYEHPGVFVYFQMGGDLGVYFTPDFDKNGVVPIQVTNNDGETLKVEDVSYEHPEHNGVPYEQIEAYSLFKIVRPHLERLGAW
jgi:hypothetical protein